MNVSFIGRLATAPEFHTFSSGTQILQLIVYTSMSRKEKDANGYERRKSQMVNVTVFGKVGEVIQKNFTKGSRIFISGDVNDISTNTGKDGKVYTNFYVNMTSFDFIDNRAEKDALFNSAGGIKTQQQQMQPQGYGYQQQPAMSMQQMSQAQQMQQSFPQQMMSQAVPNVSSQMPQPERNIMPSASPNPNGMVPVGL